MHAIWASILILLCPDIISPRCDLILNSDISLRLLMRP